MFLSVLTALGAKGASVKVAEGSTAMFLSVLTALGAKGVRVSV